VCGIFLYVSAFASPLRDHYIIKDLNEVYVSAIVSCQQDTTRKGKQEPREKKVTKRVPKSEKQPEAPAEKSKDDDNNGFLSGCFSSCLSSIDWFSCLFGSGDSEEEESVAPPVAEVPPTRELIDTAKITRELPPNDYPARDSVLKPYKSDTLKTKELPPSDYPEKDSVLKPFKSDTIDKATQEILAKKIETRHTVSPSVSEIKYIKKPLDWSRWWGGVALGIGIPVAGEEAEYGTGYILKLSTGVLLSGYIEIGLSYDFGWYNGEPLFDRSMTIYRISGDVDSIIQIPSKVKMRTESFSVGVRYVGHFGGFTDEDYFQWGLGGGFQYYKFIESIEMEEQIFRNSIYQSASTSKPTRNFWKPAVNVNTMLTYVPSYESKWWLEFNIGTSILFYSPTEQQPYSMDWIDYENIYDISLSIKFNLFDFTN